MTPVSDKLCVFNVIPSTITCKVRQRDTQKQNRYIKMEFLKLSRIQEGKENRKIEKRNRKQKTTWQTEALIYL